MMGLIRQLWRPLNPGPISPICRVCRSPKGHALCWTYVRPRSSIRATCPGQGTYHCSALRVPGLMLGPLGWSPMVLRYNHIWLVVWNMAFMTFHILGRIIPTDFHIFQRCWNHQPDNSWIPDIKNQQPKLLNPRTLLFHILFMSGSFYTTSDIQKLSRARLERILELFRDNCSFQIIFYLQTFSSASGFFQKISGKLT